MRESFGGVFMIKLVIIFIVIYITFMCLALSYAKAFRVKNRVINILEQYQYDGANNGSAINAMEKYLDEVHYKVLPVETEHIDCDENNFHYGVCIEALGNDNKRYYKVTTYILIEFPFFELYFAVPVRGETRTIIY